MEIKGKTALVTGAAGSLGSEIISWLQTQGAVQIYALDINKDALESMSNVTPLVCDITDSDAVTAHLKDLPALDIAINNAGIIHSAPLVNITSKDENRFAEAAANWQKILHANLSATFYVSQCIADSMVRARKKGVIVNISSVAAGGTAGQSAYAAAKAGVNALTKVWAKELGPLGIRCCAVAPGYIETASTKTALPQNQLDAISAETPLKKLGKIKNVLQAIDSVIENDFITGTVLEVDGGLVV